MVYSENMKGLSGSYLHMIVEEFLSLELLLAVGTFKVPYTLVVILKQGGQVEGKFNVNQLDRGSSVPAKERTYRTVGTVPNKN